MHKKKSNRHGREYNNKADEKFDTVLNSNISTLLQKILKSQ